MKTTIEMKETSPPNTPPQFAIRRAERREIRFRQDAAACSDVEVNNRDGKLSRRDSN